MVSMRQSLYKLTLNTATLQKHPGVASICFINVLTTQVTYTQKQSPAAVGFMY